MTAIRENAIKGLVFDCDGVMIDSEDANRFFYNTILAALHLPKMTVEQEKYAFMATARDALLAMTPAHMHDQLEDATRKSMDYGRDVMPRVKLMPGLANFLGKARQYGIRLAIDTNRTAEGIQRVLDFFALQDYFDPVISSSVAPPKPLPEGALEICRAWSLPAKNVLFLGDSENDMLTARNAGLKFAAFNNPGLDADFHVADYSQLETVLFGTGKVKPLALSRE